MCIDCKMQEAHSRADETAQDKRAALEWANDRLRGVDAGSLIRFARMLQESSTLLIAGPPDRCCTSREEALRIIAGILWAVKAHKDAVEPIIIEAMGMMDSHRMAA